MKVEKIVKLDAFKSIWFTWNNEENHVEAEEIFDEFELEINYELDKLFHAFYAKKNNERTFQELVELKSTLRGI